MSIREYVKDHGICILIFLICMGITEGIFLLFDLSVALQIFVFIVLFFGIFTVGLYDYYRRKIFYHDLDQKLQKLKEKYLLMEMLEKPEFLEGQIFYDVLWEMQKSMNDEIFFQIRKNNEFKRYIETWVHEVKLPIASIRIILHEYKGASARTLKEQVGRIESYVEQVLYYLRSEVPEKDYRIAPHSLKNLTDQSILENRDSLILNKVKIIQETQDISVYTDEKWLRFILGQIISNAVKYKKEDSMIRIWSQQDGKHSFLHIWDNGIGIAKEDLARVFEKSFTGKNGRIQQASTGMGLYLCSTLCNRLGHRITVQSQEGEYTQVTIEFHENEYLDVLR